MNSRKKPAPPATQLQSTLDSSLIATAPIEPEHVQVSAAELASLQELFTDMASQLEEVTAENARLKGKQSVDDVRAELLKPYTKSVFWFVVGYCFFVFVLLLMSGFGWNGFHLSDAILGIIAGSTAVSVIGLIGMVITGLFGGKSSS